MSKLNINLCNNTYTGLCQALSNIKKFINDLSYENIIVVPDKLSLYTEQKLFEILNIPVYFNLTVMGISKLANKIILDNNINYIQCTEIESKLLTLLAIQETCKNFKCFSKKYTLGFVDEVYAKIEQIKSSNSNIEDLIDENADIGTKLKFEDIQLIFRKYEELRADKLDSGALLNLYNSTCKNSRSLKNINVFFVGFESMTKQGIEVLKNTILNSNYTELSITTPYNQNNNKIYDKSFFDSVLNLCKEQSIESEIKWIEPQLPSYKLEILNNLFSKQNNYNKNNDFFTIHKSSSLSDEISTCVKNVNFLLHEQNIKFKDIAICAPKDVHPFLESELNNLNIDTFCDQNLSLYNCEPVSYLISILKYKLIEKNKINLTNIIQNDFCDLTTSNKNMLLNLVNKFSSLKVIYKSDQTFDENMKQFINQLEQPLDYEITNLSNLISFVKEIIDKHKIIEKTDKLCNHFKNIGEISLEKSYLQITDKLINLLSTLQNIPLNIQTSNIELLEIFEKALKETTIQGIPSTINQLFIGDEKDFYFDKKYLFILCMNEGITPSTILDSGLITDKEIMSKTIKAKLEPTTKIINKRNKFKIFEIILSAEKKCILSYHSHNSDNQQLQPSEFISELKFLYTNKESNSENYSLNNLSISEETKLSYNLIDTYNANLIARSINNNELQLLIKNTLIKNNSLFFKPKQNNLPIDYRELFFKNNKTSISVVEKYNKCPKSAFYSSALKLVKVEQDKIEANIIGTFIHEVGEFFIRENKDKLGTFTNKEIEYIANEICNRISNKEEYISIKLEENKFIFDILTLECIRFCSFINLEQNVSKFKPTLTEQYFGGNFKPIELTINNKKYTVTGFIDRVDEYDNYFRIIDYKTGNVTNSKGKDLLYYGTKIQLFVYAGAVKQNLNKKLFGAFYLPIKNSFSRENESNYHLSGFFINNINLVKLCDSNLSSENTKSKILNCALNKNGETVRKSPNILSEEEFESYINYSMEIVRKTIQNIEKGFIDYSPFENFCELCEFNRICKKAYDENIIRNENYEIKSNNYQELKYE